MKRQGGLVLIPQSWSARQLPSGTHVSLFSNFSTSILRDVEDVIHRIPSREKDERMRRAETPWEA